ncbi:MAG: PP2C family protein-serine/threonine phosphatase [Actinomycetes bacterium]
MTSDVDDVGGGARMASSDSALLEMLILEAPVAFAFYDTDMRYRRINRRLADVNGLSMAAHIGRRPSEILPDPLGEAIERRLADVLRSGQVIAEDDFTALSPVTGELCHYQSQWYPARADGLGVIGVAVLVSDVTERRRAEAALRRSNDRTVRLQRATAALSGALTVEDVRRVMRELGRAAGVAHRTEVVLADAAPAPAGVPVPAEPIVFTVDPASGEPSVEVALVVSGRVIGSLRLSLHEGVAGHEDEAFLGALAGQCAIALERARLYERERSTAATLQRSLLPDRLPDAPGVTLAARFLPGAADADVGGDWYDAFALPDGRLVLVVGDVMGKGVAAAAGMGRLRSALRALALVNPLPEAVLGGLDKVFSATEGPDQIATLVYLLINPAARRAAVGGAGHLPLVLVRAGRAPELIDAGSGSTPLGWPEPRAQRTLEMGPGDLLLGVTDGVVERRGYDLDEGLAELMACVAAPDGDLDALVGNVVARMLGHTEGRDDATLLAVRFVE